MKKMIDRIARRYGYMPISEAAIAVSDAALKESLARAKTRELQRQYESSTAARAAKLAAVTKRLPVVLS